MKGIRHRLFRRIACLVVIAVLVTNVTITLVDGLGEPLESWQLTRVIPLLWSIEAFETSSARVAIETLELNYGGLISDSTC